MFIERNNLAPAAALESVGAVMLIGQEMLEGTEQKSAQLALIPFGVAEAVLFQQV